MPLFRGSGERDTALQEKEDHVRLLATEEGLSMTSEVESDDDEINDPEQTMLHVEGVSLSKSARPNKLVQRVWRACTTSLAAGGEEGSGPRPTDWVDGLRGLAAFWVMNSHIASMLVKWTGSGWGSPDFKGGRHTEWYMFSLIRLIFAGQPSVYIFFVISGYALSISPVTRMNKEQPDLASSFTSLASSAFRRPIRLYLPSIVSTLFVFLLIRWRVIEYAEKVYEESDVIRGWPDRWRQFPHGDMGIVAQLYDLWIQDLRLFKILGPGQPLSRYNPVLWTIAIEYRASLMLYLLHLTVFFVKRRIRIAIVAAAIFLSIHEEMYFMHLFLAGYIFAEIDCSNNKKDTQNAAWMTALWSILVLLSIYLGSCPGFLPEAAPGYSWLSKINPHFWHRIAAIGLFGSLRGEPRLRRPFATAFGRYIGHVSFSIYLTHLPIVTVLGTLAFNAAYLWIALDSGFSTAVAFFGAYVVTVLPVFYASDRFYELVDKPSVSCARRFEAMVMRKRVE